MIIDFGTPQDIESWMKLVRKVSWNFPGLETEEEILEHEQTVLKFMDQSRAICAKGNGEVIGILLFSRKHNQLCCMAVDPDHRRQHIASKMFDKMLTLADPSRDLIVSTFQEDDPKGAAPRAFYRSKGFVEGELVMEYKCPSQLFVLHPKKEL